MSRLAGHTSIAHGRAAATASPPSDLAWTARPVLAYPAARLSRGGCCMPPLMDVLYLATGFTGALTAVWLARLALHRFRPPLSVTPHFSPGGGCTDVIVRELAAATRDVLVHAYGQDFQLHKAHARPASHDKPAAHKELAPEHHHDTLTAVARELAAAAAGDEADEKATPAAGPVVTPAAAELFSRLRKELAEE